MHSRSSPRKPYPIPDQIGQSVYPFSDQNGGKTLPVPDGAAHTYIAYIKEYLPGKISSQVERKYGLPRFNTR